MKNYYEILEVNKKASKEVIEKAYKVLIKKYHPDRYTGEKQQYAEKKTKEITAAYRILSDDFLREQYDRELEAQSVVHNNNTEQNQDRTAKKSTKKENSGKQINTNKVGTLAGTIDLVKTLIDDIRRNKERRDEIKEVTQKDIIAVILTIIIVITIGIILWFIPFTNGWIRELLFENPIFSWIGGLFS